MSRTPHIFTPEVMARVRIMTSLKVTGPEIAKKIGCDYDSLRVMCSRHGITLRQARDGDEGGIEIKLPFEILDNLRKQAMTRGVKAHELAADIIAAIDTDSLYSAILDR